MYVLREMSNRRRTFQNEIPSFKPTSRKQPDLYILTYAIELQINSKVISVSVKTFRQVKKICSLHMEKCYPAYVNSADVNFVKCKQVVFPLSRKVDMGQKRFKSPRFCLSVSEV